MRIGVYGCGYLGTVLSACLADFGMPVTCYGDDPARVNALAQGNFPFYEKNLNDVVRRNLRVGRLVCSTDLDSFCKRSNVVYIAEDSAEQVARVFVEVAKRVGPETVVVVATPVPVGTAARLQQTL